MNYTLKQSVLIPTASKKTRRSMDPRRSLMTYYSRISEMFVSIRGREVFSTVLGLSKTWGTPYGGPMGAPWGIVWGTVWGTVWGSDIFRYILF